ncbi:MAG: signal peptidase II [Planctomycetota bacterium]
MKSSWPWLFASVFVFVVALDLWSKHATFEALEGPFDAIQVWEGVLEFREVRNPGMMWGMAQEVPAVVWVLIRGSVLAALLWLFFSQSRPGKVTQLAFALVAGGALGNIYDNIFAGPGGLFEGEVRDFLHFYWFEFPTFNVADSCICVGAPLLLLVLWNQDRQAAARSG